MERRRVLQSLGGSLLGLVSPPAYCKSRTKWDVLRASNTFRDRDDPNAEPEGRREFFYRPADAWAADFIPYYENGTFHLFFLLDWRNRAAHGEGTPWYQVTTKDFVHFEEKGQTLPRGSERDQDLFVFTGSAIRAEGKYHIFYTGHNPHLRAQGKPEQGVMHAISDDLLSWQKLQQDTFYAPSDRFEPHDWRDPFVFWNDAAQEYWMLLAARLKEGPSRRRGCTGLCISKDLARWEVRKPFWTPGLYYTHECPDLFRIGDWWYLVFSEFTDLVRTRYRMSRSLDGPWLTPTDDYFDARAFYAAKTASNGSQRFIFGWDPTRAEKRDYARFDWGGNLVVHELYQESNGTLSVKIPKTIDEAWSKQLNVSFPIRWGKTEAIEDGIKIVAPGSFACVASERMPDTCKIEAQMLFDSATRGCGFMLRTSDDLEKSYYVRLEPQRERLVFDSWPRGSGPDHPITSVDGGYMPGLEHKFKWDSGLPISFKLLIDRTIAVIYVNDKIAMSVRMYDLPTGRWGLFATEGVVRFQNLKITEL